MNISVSTHCEWLAKDAKLLNCWLDLLQMAVPHEVVVEHYCKPAVREVQWSARVNIYDLIDRWGALEPGLKLSFVAVRDFLRGLQRAGLLGFDQIPSSYNAFANPRGGDYEVTFLRVDELAAEARLLIDKEERKAAERAMRALTENILVYIWCLYAGKFVPLQDNCFNKMTAKKTTARASRSKKSSDSIDSAPIYPADDFSAVKSLGTVIPPQLVEATEDALAKLRDALGGDVDGFVANRLGFTPDELAKALAQEQVEGVAMAIYNIEARSQSVIIGDQTGIGKGRQAAAMVRYGIREGYFPVFFTDRYTLFSDMYRDCKALGIAQEVPMVLNKNVSVVDFDQLAASAVRDGEDENWNIEDDETDASEADAMALYRRQYKEVYCSPKKKELDAMYAAGDVPEGQYGYMMVTYSQLKDARRDATRLEFMQSLCRKRKVLFVFDEAHRSSSVTAGKLSVITESINTLLEQCGDTQCVFLSATFAKRPECMVTFMKQTMLSSLASSHTLQRALSGGGVPMQEYVATMLAGHGQMLRREQPDDGRVTTTYTYLDSELERHAALFDRVMRYFRAIVGLSTKVKDALKLAEEGGAKAWRAYPARQQLFYINKVLLFALKAKDVAEAAVRQVRKGRSVVIGMSDTLECVLRDTIDPGTGKVERADFHALLARLLEKTVRNTKDPSQTIFNLVVPDKDREYEELLSEIQSLYDQLRIDLDREHFDLPLSPIDVMRQLITSKTFTDADGVKRHIRFEECTGRARMLEYKHPNGKDEYMEAKVTNRQKRHSNLIYNDFQNNKLDVILINATGAIGASAHATPTAEVPEDRVRQRVMLIVQNDLDVNLDLQKRGRINRTGQLEHLPPLYEYIITAIPSEKRLNMMLRAKLRSLSANTTANQDQERSQADFIDITNRYGNQVAGDYIATHPDLAKTLNLNSKSGASQLLARAAMLSVGRQQELIDDVFTAYTSLEQELRRINQWDLEREYRDFEAEFISEELFTSPVDDQALGAASRLSRFMCRHRTFPLPAAAVTKAVEASRKRLGTELDTNRELFKELEDFYRAEFERVRQRFAGRRQALMETYTAQLAELTDEESAKTMADFADRLGDPYLTQYQSAKYDKEFSKFFKKLNIKGKTIDKEALAIKFESLVNALRNIELRLEGTLKEKEETRTRIYYALRYTAIGRAYYDINDVLGLDENYERVMAVLIDVRFGKGDRKFMPSQIQYVFALSAGPRELVINLTNGRGVSNYDKVRAILGHRSWKFTSQGWDAEIAKYNDRRIARYIITGNILGAYAHPGISELQPRFITFSVANSKNAEYGLLLPMSGEGLEQVLSHVALPLSDGIALATAPNLVYRITGMGIDFSLVSARGDEGKLAYVLSVHASDGREFAKDFRFDSIREYFITSPLNAITAGRPSKDEPKRYTTKRYLATSPTFRKIIKELSAMQAVIMIPRHSLTIGADKRFNKRAVIDDSKSWPELPWRLGPVTPPKRLVITEPKVDIKDKEHTVVEVPHLLALANKTIICQREAKGKDPKMLETLGDLRQQWQNLASDKAYDKAVRSVANSVANNMSTVISDLRIFGSIWFPESVRKNLTKAADMGFDLMIDKILDTFRKKYVMNAPDHAEVRRFLDDCPADDRLKPMARSIEAYLKDEMPLIADI